MNTLERTLFIMIEELNYEINAMTPKDGFSSPRDIALVAEVNKKAAILDYLQDGMRVINPGFEINV